MLAIVAILFPQRKAVGDVYSAGKSLGHPEAERERGKWGHAKAEEGKESNKISISLVDNLGPLQTERDQ